LKDVAASVYLPQDKMALTLDGTTRWPDARRLRRLGETRTFGSPARVRDILARIADAMAETMREIRAYGKEHAEFAEIGERMIQQWEEGVQVSLKEA